MVATKDAVLMIEPFPAFCMYGITYLQQWKTLVVLTRKTLSQASRPVVRIESSSGGEIPALLNAISMRPYVSKATLYMFSTSEALVTSALTKIPPVAFAAASPDSAFMSTATIFAPSLAKRLAVARPIPLPAPVITATRPSRR